MKRRFSTRIISAAACVALMVNTQGIPVMANESGMESLVENGFVEKLHGIFDNPDSEYWPSTRWWLAEGLHTDETLIAGVKDLHDMGMNSIEIVCMPEPNVDNDVASPVNQQSGEVMSSKALYGWGSEEWIHDTELVIKEATKYGMGFSMTSGTHWANANLPEEDMVPDDDGAGKSLGYTIMTVSGGETFNGVLNRSFKEGYGVNRQDLVAVVAMKRDESSTGFIQTEGDLAGTLDLSDKDLRMVYDNDATKVLTDLVQRDGTAVTAETMQDPTGEAEFTLDWTPDDDGTYDIYIFWLQATGQSPTPSATRNFTINYIDPYGMEEFIKYYDEKIFTPEMKEVIRENGKGEIFMDSLEISASNGQTGQFWGYTLMDEFEKRRGYDLTPYLPYIIRPDVRSYFTYYPTAMLGSDGVEENKIRNDLYATMTDLYMENVLNPLKTYLNEEMNMKLRAQLSYNQLYEITVPGSAVDYIETESLDFRSQIESMRELAGAAHIYNNRYSSETGAIVGANYLLDPETFLEFINSSYLGGVTHTVLHGYSSIVGADGDSENWEGTYWPGHEGMGSRWSDRIGSRQPYSEHYSDYMPMLARTQAALSQGKPQVDIAVLHTDYYNPHFWERNTGYMPQGEDLYPDHMRMRDAMFMRDLAVQDAGYTYDYIAPENLERLEGLGITEYREGEGLVPDNVGYQAVLMYQDSIDVESAQKLLELAKKGLPVVIVNGMTERVTTGYNNTAPVNVTYEKAGVYTLGNDGREEELAAVMSELKALDNVVELSPELPDNPLEPDANDYSYCDTYVTGKTGILEALRDLGVEPRAKNVDSNQNFLTQVRRTDDALYVWANYFMNRNTEADTLNLSLDGVGKPYSVDAWTGKIAEIGEYTVEDGRTNLSVTLNPGASTIIVLDLTDTADGLHAVSTDADGVKLVNGTAKVFADKSGTYTTVLSDGTEMVNELTVADPISLDTWNLTVEDWNAGEKVYVTEDRGLGYESTEVYWTTEKTPIEVGDTALVPWKDIEAVGDDVSGIGNYTTTFTLPDDWSENNGAVLSIDTLYGNTAAVYVNGEKAPGFDFVGRTLDISGLLKAGENTIEIEVSTTLKNRMIASEYPEMVSREQTPDNYGMAGVTITPYTLAELG